MLHVRYCQPKPGATCIIEYDLIMSKVKLCLLRQELLTFNADTMRHWNFQQPLPQFSFSPRLSHWNATISMQLRPAHTNQAALSTITWLSVPTSLDVLAVHANNTDSQWLTSQYRQRARNIFREVKLLFEFLRNIEKTGIFQNGWVFRGWGGGGHFLINIYAVLQYWSTLGQNVSNHKHFQSCHKS